MAYHKRANGIRTRQAIPIGEERRRKSGPHDVYAYSSFCDCAENRSISLDCRSMTELELCAASPGTDKSEGNAMNLFTNFRVRNRQRDRNTDEARFGRLLELIRELAAEAESEMKGLQARYEQAGADAAFACQAEENEGPSDNSSTRINDLTDTIMRYSERKDILEAQAAWFRRLEKEASDAAAGIVQPFSKEKRLSEH